jgi:hypothetical protein
MTFAGFPPSEKLSLIRKLIEERTKGSLFARWHPDLPSVTTRCSPKSGNPNIVMKLPDGRIRNFGGPVKFWHTNGRAIKHLRREAIRRGDTLQPRRLAKTTTRTTLRSIGTTFGCRFLTLIQINVSLR